MKKLSKFLAIGLLGVFAASCSSNDETSIIPTDITNLRAESTPGRIVLRWDTPADASTIEYIQVNYYDHRSKMDSKRLASIYADSIEIPDTRRRYGTYDFVVKTVSPSGAFGTEHEISYTSEAAQKTWKNPSQYPLAASMFSSNAQEPTEGPVSSLVDYDNASSFFHTAWSQDIPGPHTLTISFPETIDKAFYFWYSPRNNGNNKPTNFDLMGSMTGNEDDWFLIKNFTKEADGLPTTSTGTYTSPVLYGDETPFKYLKMVVNATNNGSVFWTMGKFKFYTYEAIDPEIPAQDGVDE